MTTRPSRRALVLSTEHARHPFRRSLAPHVFTPFVEEPENTPKRSLREVFDQDWKSMLSTYCAAFVMVTAFFA